MKSLHSFSRSESEIETARDREREVKKNLENSRETRISLFSALKRSSAEKINMEIFAQHLKKRLNDGKKSYSCNQCNYTNDRPSEKTYVVS